MNKTLDDAKAEIATFCGHRLSKDCYYTCAKNRKRKKEKSLGEIHFSSPGYLCPLITRGHLYAL